MTKSRLKPCPFCGGEPELTADGFICDWEAVWVSCLKCGATSECVSHTNSKCNTEGRARGLAARKWNRRVQQ